MAKNKVWWGSLFRVLSIVTMVLPMGIWFFINRKEYFTTRTSSSMAIGVILGLIFLILIISKTFKEMNKYVSTLVFIVVGLILVWFLEPIMKDLLWIFICLLVGYVFFWPLSVTADKLLKYYSTYREEKVRVEARREAQNEDAFL